MTEQITIKIVSRTYTSDKMISLPHHLLLPAPHLLKATKAFMITEPGTNDSKLQPAVINEQNNMEHLTKTG